MDFILFCLQIVWQIKIVFSIVLQIRRSLFSNYHQVRCYRNPLNGYSIVPETRPTIRNPLLKLS